MSLLAERHGESWIVVHETTYRGRKCVRWIATGFISELAALGWIKHAGTLGQVLDRLDELDTHEDSAG
jgi:hypothetical protein